LLELALKEEMETTSGKKKKTALVFMRVRLTGN